MNIITIGDLARLSENEVSELFIKPPNRVERARTMFRKYYLKNTSKNVKDTKKPAWKILDSNKSKKNVSY